MRPTVGAAVLLFACCLATARAGYESGVCDPDKPCGDGWSHIDTDLCAKYFKDLKTFDEAENYCHSVNGELVSIHSAEESFNVLCLAFDFDDFRQNFWIGGKKLLGHFNWVDGSAFDFAQWYGEDPSSSHLAESCIEVNFGHLGEWNEYNCSKKNFFMCEKKV